MWLQNQQIWIVGDINSFSLVHGVHALFPLFIRACMYQMQKSQFKLWGQPNLIIPIQGFWSASPAPYLIPKSRFLIRLGNDPRVKEVVALQRTLTAQWPWLPSIGQNLRSFTGNGDVSIWVGRKTPKHFWNFWIHRWCTYPTPNVYYLLSKCFYVYFQIPLSFNSWVGISISHL